MAGFGSSIRLSRRDGWEGAYLDYDRLEAALTRLETLVLAVGTSTSGARGVGSRREGHEHQSLLFKPKAMSLEHGFVDRLVKHSQAFLRDLHLEIERVALFSLKKQGELADAVGSLRFAEDPIFSSTSSSGIFGGGGGLLLLQLQDEYNGTASNSINNKVDQYSHVGVELLHLLRFIGINYTGVRKILEKFEKVVYALMNIATDTNDIESTSVYLLKNSGNSSSSRNSSLSDDDHLRELANSAPIVAIQASLSQALEQCLADQDAMIANPCSLWRFEFVLDSIQTIRQSAADIVNSPFSNFLSRKAMIATGKNLNGLESSAFKAQEILLKFDPDSIRRMTFQELQDWHQRTTDMDQQQQQHKPADRRQSRHRRLMSSKGPMSTRMLVAIEDEIKQDQVDAKHYFRHWGGIDSISLAINFVSVLLYTIGYYVVAPNANHYAIALGYDGAFGATLIGASSFAALFGAFLYSFWYTKFSFKSALIFSSLCPLIGNLMYSLAASFHHRGMPMAIGGRILCGFGSAEVVNRQIISTCVSFEKMTRASAFFVAAGAVGMSAGPLLGAVFDLTAGRDYEVDVKAPFMLPKGGIIYNHITGPCFFMAALWFAQLMALLVFFREPDRLNLMSSGRHTVFDASVTGSQTNTPTTTPLTLQQGDKKVLIGNGKEKNGTRWSSVLNEVSKTARLVFQNPGLPVSRRTRRCCPSQDI
jgi:Major Facilitator Superfamily